MFPPSNNILKQNIISSFPKFDNLSSFLLLHALHILLNNKVYRTKPQYNYCCPIKLLLISKIRAETSYDVTALLILVIIVFAKKLFF